MERLLTPRDAAKLVGVSVSRIQQLSDSGRIRTIRDSGNRRLFRESDVTRFVKEHRTKVTVTRTV